MRHYEYKRLILIVSCLALALPPLGCQKQEDVIGSAVGSFVDKLFGGDAVPLVQYLAKHGKLTSDDLAKLKKMLSKKETGGDK